MMTPMDAALEVQDLSLSIDGKQIYKDISFSLAQGSFTVLCGHNGAGKSQLLRTLKGLAKPSSGRILINGLDVTRKKKSRLSSIGLVFQDADFQIVGESVEKDVAFGPINLGWSEDRVDKVVSRTLAMMGLEDKRRQRPQTLSGGEKRRLAIAGVLAMEPGLIMLDEPFANLDSPSTMSVLKALADLHQAGQSLLVTSHEVDRFLAHTDRVLILEEGRLVYQGPSKDSLDALKKSGVHVPGPAFEELTWLR